MTADFTQMTICAVDDTARFAASLFADALSARTGCRPEITDSPTEVCVQLSADASRENKDSFSIRQTGTFLTVTAQGVRGLIYGYSRFLRKCTFPDGQIHLIQSIDGDYTPDKHVRGHQLGYRACSNTYDAWTVEDYRRYCLDLMAFGSNTVELIPGLFSAERNALMQYDPDDLASQVSAVADTLDLDVSLWIPNDDLPIEESVSKRAALFARCKRLNDVFVPGGDPGNLPADAFMDRVAAIAAALKAQHPDAKMWPSAQAPHNIPDWGERFMARMQAMPDGVDGVITGPNRAFPLEELRRRLPPRYPIRLYPDVTHNVRCEYPVHFRQDDWHFSLTAALSRESVNPRPQEYRQIHELTKPYVCGSVTYSDGVNDDVNKMVWADLDDDPDRPLRETLLDYARFFLWQAPAYAIADLILSLEQNWQGDPMENPQIESTLDAAQRLSSDYPALLGNWRFCQLYFRACCDALVRRRRCFETALLDKARRALEQDDPDLAQTILETPFDGAYTALRAQIDDLAQKLFDRIGMQLDVSRFGASMWERGATLETLDLPVTDRAFYQNRIAYAHTLPASQRKAFFDGLLSRERAQADEMYFSFALHGLQGAGVAQTPDFYMDFQGDRPAVNNGTLPMSQTKLYDHFSFRCRLSGLTGGDYRLRVSYRAQKNPAVTAHRVRVNGHTLYCGTQYGGEKDPLFDERYLAPGTETATYFLPASYLENGCGMLEIDEPTEGVKLSEFWVLRAGTDEKNG